MGETLAMHSSPCPSWFKPPRQKVLKKKDFKHNTGWGSKRIWLVVNFSTISPTTHEYDTALSISCAFR